MGEKKLSFLNRALQQERFDLRIGRWCDGTCIVGERKSRTRTCHCIRSQTSEGLVMGKERKITLWKLNLMTFVLCISVYKNLKNHLWILSSGEGFHGLSHCLSLFWTHNERQWILPFVFGGPLWGRIVAWNLKPWKNSYNKGSWSDLFIDEEKKRIENLFRGMKKIACSLHWIMAALLSLPCFRFQCARFQFLVVPLPPCGTPLLGCLLA